MMCAPRAAYEWVQHEYFEDQDLQNAALTLSRSIQDLQNYAQAAAAQQDDAADAEAAPAQQDASEVSTVARRIRRPLAWRW